MKLTIKNIERANECIKQIKLLDQDLIHFEKYATILANNETRVLFEMKMNDITSQEIEAEKITIDVHGNLIKGGVETSDSHQDINRYSIGVAFPAGPVFFDGIQKRMDEISTKVKSVGKHSHILNGLLPSSLALQMLAIMTGDKMILRQKYLEELAELGIDVNRR